MLSWTFPRRLTVEVFHEAERPFCRIGAKRHRFFTIKSRFARRIRHQGHGKRWDGG